MLLLLLRRVAIEGALLGAALAVGMFAWLVVASEEEMTWDRYMTAHGGMSPPSEFVQAHKLGSDVMPMLLLVPVVLVLLVRLARWTRKVD